MTRSGAYVKHKCMPPRFYVIVVSLLLQNSFAGARHYENQKYYQRTTESCSAPMKDAEQDDLSRRSPHEFQHATVLHASKLVATLTFSFCLSGCPDLGVGEHTCYGLAAQALCATSAVGTTYDKNRRRHSCPAAHPHTCLCLMLSDAGKLDRYAELGHVLQAIRVMRKQSSGGHIFVMDGAGADGNATPRFAAYGATKRGLAQFIKSLQVTHPQLLVLWVPSLLCPFFLERAACSPGLQ